MRASADSRLKTVLLSSIVVLTNVLGNFSLSWGVKQSILVLSVSPLLLFKSVVSPWILVGVGLLILWMLSRLALFSWADLSYVVPVTSVGYVLTALAGRFFLSEQVSWQRWTGVMLIAVGAALAGATDPSTRRTGEASR